MPFKVIPRSELQAGRPARFYGNISAAADRAELAEAHNHNAALIDHVPHQPEDPEKWSLPVFCVALVWDGPNPPPGWEWTPPALPRATLTDREVVDAVDGCRIVLTGDRTGFHLPKEVADGCRATVCGVHATWPVMWDSITRQRPSGDYSYRAAVRSARVRSCNTVTEPGTPSYWFCRDCAEIAVGAHRAKYVAVEAEAWKVVPCPGCGNEVNREVCHCGVEVGDHESLMIAGHSFVPAGCDCGRDPVEVVSEGEALLRACRERDEAQRSVVDLRRDLDAVTQQRNNLARERDDAWEMLRRVEAERDRFETRVRELVERDRQLARDGVLEDAEARFRLLEMD